jgi:hypothetical protein
MIGDRKSFTGFTITPWLRQQVETHIFFGFTARHIAFGWVGFGVGLVAVAIQCFLFHRPVAAAFSDTWYLLLIPLFLLRLSKEQQAVIGWFAVQSTLGIVGPLFIIIGGVHGFLDGKADALPNLLLGILWTPSIEFIPAVTPHQKWVSIFRLLATIPVVYLGVQSGQWHW